MGFKVLFPAISAGKGLRSANFSILFPLDLYTLFPAFSGACGAAGTLVPSFETIALREYRC
jgi:hypothetical protein